MRVILDTNVLIAAFAAQGLCHALFELCIDQHVVILSEEILAEVEDNLGSRLKAPAPLAREILRYLRENASIDTGEPLSQGICRDPDDDRVLALAQKTMPDYIITGDEDLLVLREYRSIPIVSPRRFWEVLRERGQES